VFFSGYGSRTVPVHKDEASNFAKDDVGENQVENISVLSSKAELHQLAPRRERYDMHEPLRLCTTLGGARKK
jgi:hypothetical protein